MTGPGRPEDEDRNEGSADGPPGGPAPADLPGRAGDLGADRPGDGSRAPGLTSFTIEGREAPALFVVGWLGILLGAGMTFVGLLATPGVPGAILFLAGLAVLSLGFLGAGGSQAVERRAAGWREERGYAGPSPVLAFLAALPLSVLLIVLVGTPLVRIGIDPAGPAAVLVSLVVTALVYVVVVRLLVVGTEALSWRELGVVRPDRDALRDVAWGALLAFPVLFVTGLLALALSRFLPIPESPLPPAPDPFGFTLNLVTAAIVAPIGEEIFFRGFATTAWARLLGEQRALVRGAIFFALVHVLTIGGTGAIEGIGLAAFAFAVRVPVSLALGWVFLRRRTLYAPIALHAAYNGLPILLAGTPPAVP